MRKDVKALTPRLDRFLLRVDPEQLRLIRRIRGQYLEAAIEVEHQVNNVIGIHFFPNWLDGDPHFRQFENTVLGHRSLGFGAKVEILRYVLEQSYPRLFKKYSNLLSQLQSVIERRNILAHGQFIEEMRIPLLLGEKVGPPKQVTIHTFRKGRISHRELTVEQARKQLKEAKEASRALGKLWGELYRSNNNKKARLKEFG